MILNAIVLHTLYTASRWSQVMHVHATGSYSSDLAALPAIIGCLQLQFSSAAASNPGCRLNELFHPPVNSADIAAQLVLHEPGVPFHYMGS